jgi:hypothetical protein
VVAPENVENRVTEHAPGSNAVRTTAFSILDIEENIMKRYIAVAAVLSALVLSACEQKQAAAPPPVVVTVPGPAGPQGATGATGLPAEKGETGATGMTGADGVKGDRGNRGGDTIVVVPAQDQKR